MNIFNSDSLTHLVEALKSAYIEKKDLVIDNNVCIDLYNKINHSGGVDNYFDTVESLNQKIAMLEKDLKYYKNTYENLQENMYDVRDELQRVLDDFSENLD